jgi:monovalent cation:H+ antiporter-2, CPA2 family
MQGIDFIQDLAVILVAAGTLGWVCQRLGLSVVVGFLAAGILVGPHTPPFAFVTDAGRIETAAQVGIVFLMFSIGLRLSLRRLRRLGLSLLVAVFGGAGVVYYLTRLFGAISGFDGTESLFLAAMFMVSSSAIISKVLAETGVTHERSGQLAMGVTVLEDVVAVVMLTVLNSVVQFGGLGRGPKLGETLGLFGAFVVLAVIAGLLLVPWLLRRMSISAEEELQTLGIAGLLFGLAMVAERAGYSLALGAFLLGTIVAETPHRHQIERTFGGMRDVFSAVFFVAIGMQIDPSLLGGAWVLILSAAVFILVVRTLAIATGLVLIGKPPREALQAGVLVTPIGEFSFIIAQIGVTAAVVPEQFYPLAVGVCLLTTLVAPLLTRRAEPMTNWILARQPRWLDQLVRDYHAWLKRLQVHSKRNLLWQLSRTRFVQIGIWMFFVTGLLVFSRQLFEVVRPYLGLEGQLATVAFWVALTLIVIAPLVAIWRNISALALLYAQVSTQGHPKAQRLAQLVEVGLKNGAIVMLYVWLSSFLPAVGGGRWLLPATLLAAALAVLLLRKRLIRWHSEMEVSLHDVLEGGENRLQGSAAPWLRSHAEWDLHVVECVLPDLADVQGKRISELDLRARFGCTVVGIERQGYMITLPPPETVLYPRDKVLLLGTSDQTEAGVKALTGVSGGAAASDFDEMGMEVLVVPQRGPACGATLKDLAPAQRYNVQVAGVRRAGYRLLNPQADEQLQAGDELLALGTPAQIAEFRAELIQDGTPKTAAGANEKARPVGRAAEGAEKLGE